MADRLNENRQQGGMDERLCEMVVTANVADPNALSQMLSADPSILNRVMTSESEEKNNPLHLGALYGRDDLVREILERKPELARQLNSKRQSPLHIASERGHVKVVKELLSRDPNVCFVRDKNGRLPLHLAAINGHVDVLKALVDAKSITAWLMTDEGEPLLHLCAKQRQFMALEELVNHIEGDKDKFLSLKNNRQETIFHLLSAMGHTKLVANLLEKLKDKNEIINAQDARMSTALDVVEENRWEPGYWGLRHHLHKAGGKRARDLSGGKVPTTAPAEISKRDRKWLERKEPSIIVVAVLITTVTFDAVRSPPGGLWQQDTAFNGTNGNGTYKAGEAILSDTNPLSYIFYSLANQVAFFASSTTILFILIKARLPAKYLVWVLIASMWIAIVSMWIAYLASLYSVGSGDPQTKTYENLACAVAYGLALAAPMTMPLWVPRCVELFQTMTIPSWVTHCKELFQKITSCRRNGQGGSQV